ncbi:hypothetical protein FMH11_18055 [Vibrio cholerae]|nr:hypothetical protein [Vibrio cholerae]
MTELETQLLNAFEQLQTQHETQQKEFVKLYNDLAGRFERSRQESEQLQSSVSSLTKQVNGLTEQLQQLARFYSAKNR